MSKITIQAESRPAGVKPKVVRRQGGVPANISIPHEASLSITLPAKALKKLLEQGHESGLVYVEMTEPKASVPVLFDEIQADGMTGEVLHVALKKVSLKEKVKAEIPLEFVGEITTPNLVLVKVKESVEVEALPTDLPEHIVVDISSLTEAGQAITLKDLKFDTSKAQLTVAAEELETPVVLLQEQKVEPVEEVAPAEGETEAVEGEAAAEAAKPEGDVEKSAES